MNTCRLQKVIFYIKELSEHELAGRVFMDLWLHGIEAERLPVPKAGTMAAQRLDAASCMIVTDTAELATYYSRNGYAVIVYLHEKNKTDSFSDCQYAVEDFSGLEHTYMNTVFCRKHGIPLEILRTKRCILREITTADVPELYRIYADPEITRYMEPLFADVQEEMDYTEKYIQNVYGFYGYGMWIVELIATGEIIGRVGIEQKEDEEPELGYMIAVPYQRQGYAYEVCRAVLGYAQMELQLGTICARVQAENTASVRLCEKLGFQEMGTDSEKKMKIYKKTG